MLGVPEYKTSLVSFAFPPDTKKFRIERLEDIQCLLVQLGPGLLLPRLLVSSQMHIPVQGSHLECFSFLVILLHL